MFLELLIAIVLLLAAWFVSKRKDVLPNLPRVKGGWPLAGNALQLNQCGRADQTLEKWAEQYGPIFTVKVFNMTWVVLSGYDEIHEVLVQKSKVFAGRHRFFRFSYLVFGDKDIVMSDPTLPNFQPMRKALHRTIQPRGNNLNRIETVLIDMAQQLVAKIKSHNGKPFDIKDDLYKFACKVAVTMICGQHVTDEDEILADMIQFDQLTIENISPISGVELDFFPWLRHFGHPVWKKLQHVTKVRRRLFEKLWQLGTDSYSTNDEPTCVVHAMAQTLDKQSKFYEPSLTMEHAESHDVRCGRSRHCDNKCFRLCTNQFAHTQSTRL
jgi:cytochrome P450